MCELNTCRCCFCCCRCCCSCCWYCHQRAPSVRPSLCHMCTTHADAFSMLTSCARVRVNTNHTHKRSAESRRAIILAEARARLFGECSSAAHPRCHRHCWQYIKRRFAQTCTHNGTRTTGAPLPTGRHKWILPANGWSSVPSLLSDDHRPTRNKEQDALHFGARDRCDDDDDYAHWCLVDRLNLSGHW